MILAHRIPFPQYADDAQFAITLAFLQRHRAVVDEICLFTENTNVACLPLAQFTAHAAIIGRRLPALREAGFAPVGINMLSSLGHVDDVAEYYAPLPFPPMVGHDGQVARMCPCPTAPAFRGYLAEKYRLLAVTRPDFIWVDDDFRMQGHSVAYACFCPACLARFGAEPAREALLARMNAPEGGELRRAWIAHNSLVLDELAALIAGAVHAVDPAIELGLMTAGPAFSSYSGQDFARWYRTLGGRRARPGGGFYEDSHPLGMLAKSIDIGRQCVAYPPLVTNVQYELENYPCLPLDKSLRTLYNECLLALANGCNGVAFSAFRYSPSDMEEYEPLFAGLTRERPLWEAYLQAADGLPAVGAWHAYADTLMANRAVRNGDWFAWGEPEYNVNAPLHLAEIGLPMTVARAGACLTLLTGRLAEIFPNDELRAMLAGGVLLDADALQVLWERGLGELTGVRVGRTIANGVRELFSDHPLNAGFAGDGRMISLAYFPAAVCTLEPVAPGVEEVSRLVRILDDATEEGMCVSSYENSLGGRVATMTYLPWVRHTTPHKRAQILRLADWVSRARLPLLIDHPCRLLPFVRSDGRRLAAVLLNAAFDALEPLTLRLRAQPDTLWLLTPEGEIALEARRAGAETHVTLPALPPWQAAVLVGR